MPWRVCHRISAIVSSLTSDSPITNQNAEFEYDRCGGGGVDGVSGIGGGGMVNNHWVVKWGYVGGSRQHFASQAAGN